MRITVRTTETFLESLHSSIPKLMTGSIRLMELVRAAMKSMRKNSPFQSVLSSPGIRLKAAGRISKVRLGPRPGSNPMAKTAGKIASPAISAAVVSRAMTMKEDLTMLSSFLR